MKKTPEYTCYNCLNGFHGQHSVSRGACGCTNLKHKKTSKRKKPYFILPSGGDNLGGPSLRWWIVCGPGLGRTNFHDKRLAQAAADCCNLVYVESKQDSRVAELVGALKYALTYGPDCATDNKLHAIQRDGAIEVLRRNGGKL